MATLLEYKTLKGVCQVVHILSYKTHSEVRVTIHSHCRHKNLDTYKYIHNDKNSICSSRFDFVLALPGNSSCLVI